MGKLPYTADEIAERLGATTGAFLSQETPLGAREIAAIRAAGITRIEVCGIRSPKHFDFGNSQQAADVVRECREQGVEIVSFHGPSVEYASTDEEERGAAVKEAAAAARVADDMGASVMVCHFGTSEESKRTIVDMLEELDGSAIRLANENGVNLRDYMALVDEVGSDRFGMVVDVGHTRDEDGVNPFIKPDRARETLAQCGPRLIHLHLHDFLERDHIAPMDGNLQWAEVFGALKDIDYQGHFMFEALLTAEGADNRPEYVLAKTAEFPQAFAAKYG